jgi:hypothetical protein
VSSNVVMFVSYFVKISQLVQKLKGGETQIAWSSNKYIKIRLIK